MIETKQLHQHQNVWRRKMIMKSRTYTSLLVELDTKSIVGISFFLQRFCKKQFVTGIIS